jgi:hypothetical protein
MITRRVDQDRVDQDRVDQDRVDQDGGGYTELAHRSAIADYPMLDSRFIATSQVYAVALV